MACIEHAAQRGFGFLHVGKGGGDDLPFAHHRVELAQVGFLALEVAAVLHAVDHEG